MSDDAFIGEIMMFAGNFAPRGWHFADGSLIPIAENTALFSLYGTTFGGDGRTTFGLPDLRGRFPMHPGHGPGLTSYRVGETRGAETAGITPAQAAAHTHVFNASADDASVADPNGAFLATVRDDAYGSGGADATMHATAVGPVGQGQDHANLHPYQTVNFVIRMVGEYPSRP